MKTISLPYICSKDDRNFIKDEIRKSSNMLRFSYKRFQNGKSEKEIRLLSKDLKIYQRILGLFNVLLRKQIIFLKQVEKRLFSEENLISFKDYKRKFQIKILKRRDC